MSRLASIEGPHDAIFGTTVSGIAPEHFRNGNNCFPLSVSARNRDHGRSGTLPGLIEFFEPFQVAAQRLCDAKTAGETANFHDRISCPTRHDVD